MNQEGALHVTFPDHFRYPSFNGTVQAHLKGLRNIQPTSWEWNFRAMERMACPLPQSFKHNISTAPKRKCQGGDSGHWSFPCVISVSSNIGHTKSQKTQPKKRSWRSEASAILPSSSFSISTALRVPSVQCCLEKLGFHKTLQQTHHGKEAQSSQSSMSKVQRGEENHFYICFSYLNMGFLGGHHWCCESPSQMDSALHLAFGPRHRLWLSQGFLQTANGLQWPKVETKSDMKVMWLSNIIILY